jgi:hypothetical protein
MERCEVRRGKMGERGVSWEWREGRREEDKPSEDDGEVRVLDEHDLLFDRLVADLRHREEEGREGQ